MRSEDLKNFSRTEGWQYVLEQLDDWEHRVLETLAEEDDPMMVYRNQGLLQAIRKFRDLPKDDAE